MEISLYVYLHGNIISNSECFQVGSTVQATTQTTTTNEPDPHFEASNLVNNHPLSMDGPAVRMYCHYWITRLN